MPSAQQQRMSQVAKMGMVLWVWRKIILPLLGSKTSSYTTAPPYPQTHSYQIKTKVVLFLVKRYRKRMRGSQRSSVGNLPLHPFKI